MKLLLGQVHHATLLSGQPVAIKIQYPGVAQGIESDIENLVGVMKVKLQLILNITRAFLEFLYLYICF